MSTFNFDPQLLFQRRRPRVVRTPRYTRFRKIALIVIAVIVVLVLVALALAQLRVNFLYLSSLGHTNVFWTPLIAHVVLFLIGAVITGGLVGASVPFWARAVRGIDALAGRITFWTGIAIAVLAGIAGGAHLAGSWQDVLLFIHGHAFGATDPVFHMDYGFFVFTLPVIDAFSALLWGGAVVGLLGAIAVVCTALMVIHALVVVGFLLLGVSTLAYQAHLISPILWMILAGAGLYVAYTPFNAMLFDRLVAFSGRVATAGFLIYVADASGYMGSVA